MAQSIMQRIQELNEERERLVARESMHHASDEDHQRLEKIDHNVSVLWDLRRRELAGERRPAEHKSSEIVVVSDHHTPTQT